MMEPYTDWAEHLAPASIILTHVDQLTSLSVGGGDVSINDSLSEQPKSFGACVALVNAEVWWSFYKAQNIMNRIEGHFRGVSRTMAKTLLDFSQEEVEKTSPTSQLETKRRSMHKTSQICEDLARQLETPFSPVINLLQKLLQAFEAAEKGCEAELTRVRALKATITVKPFKEEPEPDGRKRKEELDEALKDYKKAFPTWGMSASMGLIQALKTALTNSEAGPGAITTEQDETDLTEMAFQEVKLKWEALTSALEQEEREFRSLEKQNQELSDTECVAKKCEVREGELEAAGRTLIPGMEALRSMTQQWENMARFTERISGEINSCFTNYSDAVQRFQQLTNPSAMDQIYSQTLSAASVAQFVQEISDTYVTVSNTHLMPLLEELKKITTKEITTKSSYKSLRSKEKIEETQEKISTLMREKEKAFKYSVKQQMETIEKEIKAKQPPVSREKLKAMEDALQQAMRELSIQ